MSFRLDSQIVSVNALLRKRAGNLVHDTAAQIEAIVRVGMAEPKSGAKRRSSKTGRAHIASAPGESPAIDTSLLVNSLSYQMTGETAAVVGVGAEYAVHLELGTAHIAPRPFLEPAAAAVQADFEKGLRALL